jgi:hypothetical protein
VVPKALGAKSIGQCYNSAPSYRSCLGTGGGHFFAAPDLLLHKDGNANATVMSWRHCCTRAGAFSVLAQMFSIQSAAAIWSQFQQFGLAARVSVGSPHENSRKCSHADRFVVPLVFLFETRLQISPCLFLINNGVVLRMWIIEYFVMGPSWIINCVVYLPFTLLFSRTCFILCCHLLPFRTVHCSSLSQLLLLCEHVDKSTSWDVVF